MSVDIRQLDRCIGDGVSQMGGGGGEQEEEGREEEGVGRIRIIRINVFVIKSFSLSYVNNYV